MAFIWPRHQHIWSGDEQKAMEVSAEPEEVLEEGEAAAVLSKDQWQAVRDALKAALLTGEVPLEPKEMKPKAVHQLLVASGHLDHAVDYTNKSIRDKFQRLLLSLRKKHKDGDLERDLKGGKTIEWGKSAAKQYLKKCFRDGTISSSYLSSDAEQIWKAHCQTHPAFARMQYDDSFIRRLKYVRDDYLKKVDRRDKDLAAYTAAKNNHPTPEFNHRGEPQWNGSAAQALLREMVANGSHVGVLPRKLWEQHLEFQVYGKKSFRDHIYQEQRLIKFNNYVEALRQKKIKELQY